MLSITPYPIIVGPTVVYSFDELLRKCRPLFLWMHRYLKSVLIANWSIGFLKFSPFLEKIQKNNKASSRFFSAIAVLSQNLDYSGGEDEHSFVPPQKSRLDSIQVCNNLHNLRTKPSVAFAYFKDCENLGFCHDLSTYTAIISILYIANRKRSLVSLFTNLISLNTNTGLQVSSIFFSLLQSSNGSDLVSFALDALLKSYETCKRDPQEAANAFLQLGKLGVLPSVSSCNFLLNFVAKSGNVGTLMSVFDHMRGFCINPDVYSFTILMKFFLNAKQPSEAIRIFGLMEQTGMRPDRLTYLTLLSGMSTCERYDLCNVILQAMVGEEMQVSLIDFNMVIYGFCKESRLDEAEKLLQTMYKLGMHPDHYAYEYIIRAYCAKGNLLKALDLYQEMTSRGIKTTPRIVAHLLQSLHKLGMNNEVLLCFTKLKELGVALDRVLYNIVINACCQLGLFRVAMELIQEMRNNGLDPDIIHYTCLIAGFCYRGDVANARMVFIAMLKLGLKPDTVTYNVLLIGFCNNGLIDEVIDLLEQMMVQGIKLNAKTYGLVIEGFCKGGKVCEAELLFKVLDQRNLSNQMGQTGRTHLFSSMISGYLHRGLTESAYGLFLRFSQQGYLINKFSREWLIRELCNRDKVKLASNLFRVILRDHQTVPDLLSYAKIITAFCQKGNMSGALFWFEDMLNRGIYADLLIYTTLMDGYCKVGRLHDACELFVEMARVGIKPDVVAYNVLLDGHFKSVFKTCWSETGREKKKLEIKAKVLKLTQHMMEDGIEPDVACYTALIDGHVKMEYLNNAEKLFDEMLRKGLRPDVRAYTALMHGYFIRGEIEKAQDLFQRMVDSGLAPDSVALFVLDTGMLDASEKKKG
jgi:pentatricopeptide repeat protein